MELFYSLNGYLQKPELGIGEWNEGNDGNAWSQGESNMITRNQGGKAENWGWG